ncbi:MAG: hypothetical protein WCG93_09890 [Paludibacter sp.]
MKNLKVGILLGLLAGIIDVIPMLVQQLTWDANLSALSMWLVVGIFISTVDWKINSILKGVLISFLVLLPSAIIIGWSNPIMLVPIFSMTLILGGILGFSINKINKQKHNNKNQINHSVK